MRVDLECGEIRVTSVGSTRHAIAGQTLACTATVANFAMERSRCS